MQEIIKDHIIIKGIELFYEKTKFFDQITQEKENSNY